MEHTRKQGEMEREGHVEESNSRASRKMVHGAHMPAGELACEGKCGGFQQQGLRDGQFCSSIRIGSGDVAEGTGQAVKLWKWRVEGHGRPTTRVQLIRSSNTMLGVNFLTLLDSLKLYKGSALYTLSINTSQIET